MRRSRRAPDAGLNTSGGTFLSSDSSPGPAVNMPHASLEFDRLMEDSPEGGLVCAEFAAAFAKTPVVNLAERLLGSLGETQDSPEVTTGSEPPLATPAADVAVPQPSATMSFAAVAAPAAQRASSIVSMSSTLPFFSPEAGGEGSWALAQLSSRLEEVSREMRRTVEHEFVLAERALETRHRSDMEAQRMKADAKDCLQSTRIEGLQAENQQLSRALEIKQRKVKESLSLLHRARRGLVGRCALEVAWRTWRSVAAASKDERIHSLLSDKVRTTRLLGHTFSSWRRHTQLQQKEALVAHERAAAETVRARLFEKLESEREALVAEAERLKKQLVEEGRQRALLQENVQRVFMRGVCALNFEAMSLLKDGGGSASEAPTGTQRAGVGAVASTDWDKLGGGCRQSMSSAVTSTAASPSCDVFGVESGNSATTSTLTSPSYPEFLAHPAAAASLAPTTASSAAPAVVSPACDLFAVGPADGAHARDEVERSAVPPSPTQAFKEVPVPEHRTAAAAAAALEKAVAAIRTGEACPPASAVSEVACRLDRPRSAPEPLPFVSYSPPEEERMAGGPGMRFAHDVHRWQQRAHSKGQKWQAAGAPRTASHPSPEVMTAGG